MNRVLSGAAWVGAVALLVASAAVIALGRGETINALWIVVCPVCTCMVAYRFYGLFIAVLAGAVQDFIVLSASTRRDGRSLGDIVRMELRHLRGTPTWRTAVSTTPRSR